MLWINMPAMLSANMSFGGIKDSAYGSERPGAPDASLSARSIAAMGLCFFETC